MSVSTTKKGLISPKVYEMIEYKNPINWKIKEGAPEWFKKLNDKRLAFGISALRMNDDFMGVYRWCDAAAKNSDDAISTFLFCCLLYVSISLELEKSHERD